jgi:periplasmic protein TonB
MRDPLSRSFSSPESSQDSWLHRIRDNFRQLLVPAGIFPSSANGAPIHFLKWQRSRHVSRAQGASLLTHAAIIAALVVAAVHPPVPNRPPLPPGSKISRSIPSPAALLDAIRGHDPNGGSGSGSGHDLLPPTRGNLPSRSSTQLLKPSLPENPHPELPLPPTILDPSAAPILTPVVNIGLPWMPDENNSSGRGKGTTIGEGPGDSIGSFPGDDAGWSGTPGRYRPGLTLPRCAYCPDPQYTDEAREAKLQGTVTLQVLVAADGRALQIRLAKGIDSGLDDHAIQSVRGWRFIPAHDASRRPVACWVTVEVVFRLF